MRNELADNFQQIDNVRLVSNAKYSKDILIY